MSETSGEPGEDATRGGPARRPPWSAFRAALEGAGFRPSRRLGQNFLLDENMCRALVRDAGVGPGDFVLEVGAGCGFLTAHLAESGARVLAVEVDARLHAIASRFLGGRAGLELLLCDVLANKRELAPQVARLLPREAPWALVANLAYSISAPLMAVLSELEHPPGRMHVLVQREVAERIAAPPGDGERGSLSVKLQALYRAELGRAVPAGLFWPRPKVESRVLHLELRADAPAPELRRALDRLARALFQHRRQGVGRLLADATGEPAAARALCESSGIDSLRRPESLDERELLALASSELWQRSSGAGE